MELQIITIALAVIVAASIAISILYSEQDEEPIDMNKFDRF